MKEIIRKHPNFINGDTDKNRQYVKWRWKDSSKEVWGIVKFGEESQGAYGHVQSGCLAALLDEAMGLCALLNGRTIFLTKLTVFYKSAVPLNSVARVVAVVKNVSEDIVFMEGAIYLSNETLACEAEGVYKKIVPDKFTLLLSDIEEIKKNLSEQ